MQNAFEIFFGKKNILILIIAVAYIERIQPFGVPLNVLTTIAEYYIANKPYDSDWCVLPVTNIEAYLGSFALNKQYMNKIPAEFMQKKETSYGIAVCVCNLAGTISTDSTVVSLGFSVALFCFGTMIKG